MTTTTEVTATLPKHLQKYIVEQDYTRYTARDHAVWRFILRQLKHFLSDNAHDSYLEGLEKTGIEIDRIPSISDISAKIEKFGWRALPVSGFIPPAAFMELQSLSVLPIASDIRTLLHLEYTPAPDIVHEAAGHAPILVQPEFAAYLKHYAQVARKAIISKNDIETYRAIRNLSDLKEHPNSSSAQITAAENQLNALSKSTAEISEASILGRMNWWTAEYGLIGDLKNPKIFGAGLLSSLGESRGCLSDKVKKMPLTLACIDFSYDITEQQPQLFVTPNFAHLGLVLEELANTMAFRRGGLESLLKAIRAETVNTIELDSGLQISGLFQTPITDAMGEVIYYRTTGPSQLSYQDSVLSGHNHDNHSHGFSAPLGSLKKFPKKSPAELTSDEWHQLDLELTKLPQAVTLEFSSGVQVKGRLKDRVLRDGKTLILSFDDCTVSLDNKILFEPGWGDFDLALGTRIVSVFGGAADREAFGETEDFEAVVIPPASHSAEQKTLFSIYQSVRSLREAGGRGEFSSTKSPHAHPAMILRERLQQLLLQAQDFPDDWLLILELYEIAKQWGPSEAILPLLQSRLLNIGASEPRWQALIEAGLQIAHFYMPGKTSNG